MQQIISQIVIPALWLAWLAYWGYASRDVKATRWSESVLSRASHLAPLVFAGILLSRHVSLPVLSARFLPRNNLDSVLGAVLVAAGLGFSVWARRHLGRNWSSLVVLKQDHALVRSGPYRRLRHPIYTGILLAFLGVAVTVGEGRGLLALAFAFLAFERKIREEERRMRETFPEYDQYRRETFALIPHVF
jgi:protein-S-isoprenylcysteine O-methyltransferase Ste14